MDINVYSDGSWIYPLEQYLGLGGAGVWWPGRNIATNHRLSTAEKELAYSNQRDNGLMVYTPIGGYSGSSTRTELAAAILAISANGPVHIGTDSQAFHDKAIKILGDLRRGKKQKRSWQLVSDGDLWQHFEQAAKAKGINAIRITKVKGHVNQDQVNSGKYRQVDKDGNDKADAAADIATKMHGEEVVSVAKILSIRHKQYGNFMKQVAKHIVEAYLIHRKLVDRIKARQPKEQATVKYLAMQMQDASNSTKPSNAIKLQGSIGNYSKFKHKHRNSPAIWHFIDNLSYREVDNQYHATTWLELYLIYRVKGYPKPIGDRASKARARATIFSQLNEFKRVVKGVVERAAKDEAAKGALRPMHVTHQRFLNLGIAGRHATINCSVEVDKQTADLIEYNLIRLGHYMSDKKVQLFKEGKVELKANKPNFRGRSGWDSNLKVLKGFVFKELDYSANASGSKRLLQPECFQCPSCKASTISTNPAFQSDDLDKVCKCATCKSNAKSNMWLCSCGIKWHTCDKHKHIQLQNSKKPPSGEPTARPKRQIGPLTNEQLQEIDTKRMRKSSNHLLPPSSNILSAKLRERFAHLL